MITKKLLFFVFVTAPNDAKKQAMKERQQKMPLIKVMNKRGFVFHNLMFASSPSSPVCL